MQCDEQFTFSSILLSSQPRVIAHRWWIRLSQRGAWQCILPLRCVFLHSHPTLHISIFLICSSCSSVASGILANAFKNSTFGAGNCSTLRDLLFFLSSLLVDVSFCFRFFLFCSLVWYFSLSSFGVACLVVLCCVRFCFCCVGF